MNTILRLDIAGNPLHWIDQEEAAGYYAKNQVAWTLGEPFHILHGGRNRHSGLQSIMDIHPVIAIKGRAWTRFAAPALTNATLFRRDGHLCMYCGQKYGTHRLTRDHVFPSSRGGKDIWTNVVTACRFPAIPAKAPGRRKRLICRCSRCRMRRIRTSICTCSVGGAFWRTKWISCGLVSGI